MDESKPLSFVAGDQDGGKRLDRAVHERLEGCSRKQVALLIAHRLVRVDGRCQAKGYSLRPGQMVEVAQRPPSGQDVVPSSAHPIDVPVLYEDGAMIVVSKPALAPCFPLLHDEHGTVAGALVARYPELLTAGDVRREAGLAHRLDTITSGVLVFARTPRAFGSLVAQIRSGACRKQYLAVVEGRCPAGNVDVALGFRGKRAVTRAKKRTDKLLPALTKVEPLEVWKDTSLVQATISAGRRHQIRAHLAHMGHPICGDTLYGAALSKLCARPLLHAQQIELLSPDTGEMIRVEAPLSEDMEAFVAEKREAHLL